MPASGSSATSSRTSTRSSTSDGSAAEASRGPSVPARLGGLVRLTHPFPSLLNGLATSAFALLAGGGPEVAVRLGLAMAALQASIGALNDVVDATDDAVGKPSKPIPAGFIGRRAAVIVAAVGLAVGLALAAASGPAATAIAIAGVACGYGYDLRLKRTALSWLPLAVALPLLPAFAWVGVGAELPAAFALLVPLAVLGGAGLALSNALAGLEADRMTGLSTVVGRLGRGRAWAIHGALLVGVIGGALISLSVLGGRGPGVAGAYGASAVILAGALLARGGGARRLELAWEVEAVGVAGLGAAWLAALTRALG